MSKKVLLLHGWGGSNFPHWQSWLAGEIAKEYGKVSFFSFSDFENPNLDIWMGELIKELEEFKPDIVICHSLATTLWFHLCNTQEVQSIETLYLVAPPSLTTYIPELATFFPLSLPQNLYAKEALLIASTNDPYMSEDEAKRLQKKLNIPMEILENAGHINGDSGYGEWPWIKEELKKKL
ncbi:serine hydrolase family protein [Sulfurimonas aquatica]|uniref:Serine hydrolase family protein n=1 Tax=Sulfurimonas aquatica TaxID=2672570 RepID=A0A975GC06_9BACT|nr:alpha/beta hydrolase [Sulfurimonas aquatica]QSZ40764.1 serine hydrolase family protein [Sulfurimonas aquatica]